MTRLPVSYAAAALYGFGLEAQLEEYERAVDRQLEEEGQGWDEAGMYHADEFDELTKPPNEYN
jgi:hypothetical protein